MDRRRVAGDRRSVRRRGVVEGERYRRSSEGTVRYPTLCGAVAVRRAIDRRVGVHNGPTAVPLERAAGLWEHATPALAFSVTQGFAAGDGADGGADSRRAGARAADPTTTRGSGATEGACKSLVTVRFKRSGQRWFESGVAPGLSLRALHLGDRLRPAFARIAARRPATLEAA